jgi:hypothetical protein
MAIAAAALTNAGVRPAPRLAVSVKTPLQGWVVLPTATDPVKAMDPAHARAEVENLMLPGQPFWQWTAEASQDKKSLSWSLTGTLPDWQGSPLAAVVLLEDNDSAWAGYIGLKLLETTTQK